jgi:hypothetical protein
MNDKPINLFSRMILNSEGGELHLVFLLAHSFIIEEVPTLENTRQLTGKSNEFKKAYLNGHFHRANSEKFFYLDMLNINKSTFLTPK